MTEDDLITLDKKEGLPDAYKRIMVEIALEDDVTFQDVITYIACEDRLVPFSPLVEAYKQDLIDGAVANNLSQEWIEMLKALPTQEEKKS